MAYVARVGEKRFNVSEKWSVVVDGKEQSPYEGIGGLTFSSDSRHVAYVAGEGPKQFVVVDGKEGRQYDGLVKGATCVFDSASELHFLARKNASSDGKSHDLSLIHISRPRPHDHASHGARRPPGARRLLRRGHQPALRQTYRPGNPRRLRQPCRRLRHL